VETTRYGIRITGPDSDEWTGWAMRNAIDANGSVIVGVVKSLKLAEKNRTEEEAVETAFVLVAQQPHLIGRVKVMKLKPSEERPNRWTVECECSP
jgi:hypothetical protein